MLNMMMGVALMMAAQDVPPLAGTLPPLPPPRAPGQDRARGPLFISPMGEPFRGPNPVRTWFDNADANHDGALTLAEFVADADRLFARLDRGRDGEIDPDDIEYYETVLAPEIRTGGAGGGGGAGLAGRAPGGRGEGRGEGRGGGGRRPPGSGGFGEAAKTQRYGDVRRGAARFGFFDYPEPIVVADTNLNRGVDPREFRDAAVDRFTTLDKNHDGRITFGELPRLATPTEGGGRFAGLRGAGGPPPEDQP